jgi:hypothetical protein
MPFATDKTEGPARPIRLEAKGSGPFTQPCW